MKAILDNRIDINANPLLHDSHLCTRVVSSLPNKPPRSQQASNNKTYLN